MAGEGRGEAAGEAVRGGLHEVDLPRRRMRCVYWPEHAHRIARGAWFVEKGADWVPLKVGREIHLYTTACGACTGLSTRTASRAAPGSSRRAPIGCRSRWGCRGFPPAHLGAAAASLRLHLVLA